MQLEIMPTTQRIYKWNVSSEKQNSTNTLGLSFFLWRTISATAVIKHPQFT